MLAVVFLLVMVVWGSATVGYTRVDGSDEAGDGSESTIDGSDHKHGSHKSTQNPHSQKNGDTQYESYLTDSSKIMSASTSTFSLFFDCDG